MSSSDINVTNHCRLYFYVIKGEEKLNGYILPNKYKILHTCGDLYLYNSSSTHIPDNRAFVSYTLSCPGKILFFSYLVFMETVSPQQSTVLKKNPEWSYLLLPVYKGVPSAKPFNTILLMFYWLWTKGKVDLSCS